MLWLSLICVSGLSFVISIHGRVSPDDDPVAVFTDKVPLCNIGLILSPLSESSLALLRLMLVFPIEFPLMVTSASKTLSAPVLTLSCRSTALILVLPGESFVADFIDSAQAGKDTLVMLATLELPSDKIKSYPDKPSGREFTTSLTVFVSPFLIGTELGVTDRLEDGCDGGVFCGDPIA